MIAKLSGTFDGTTPEGAAIILVGGVGYCVRLAHPGNHLSPGEHTSLFIHTAVREDALDLYGFTTEEELQFFKQLMGVSGIGPKTALSIMGASDLSALKRAIASGDTRALVSVFGIGKKSAERLVVELRDKVHTSNTADTGDDSEVMEALLSLGYTASEIRKVLKGISAEIQGTKERLGAALRALGTT